MSRLVVSANLEMRLLHVPDAEELFCLTEANRAYLRRWLPWLDGTRTVTDSREFIVAVLRQFAGTRAFVAGIRSEGQLAGVLGHNRIDWDSRTSYLGYWLGSDFQGRGIMTACCRTLLDHAFLEFELERVVITCATENARSRAVPERLGFRYEGIEPRAEWLYDHFVDHAVYALTAKEFADGAALR